VNGEREAKRHPRRARDAGSDIHNDGSITIPGGTPMFFFDDPFGNGLVYTEEG